MFPIDPRWVYIGVPIVLVSILVLIKFRQRKVDKKVESASAGEEREEVGPSEKDATEEGLVKVKETSAEPESSEEAKPQNCPHFLGYLYMRKAPDKNHIPSECYSCPKLLKCLYSPSIIEKVYEE